MIRSYPPRQPSFFRFIIDQNPFFLLSALCMFVGCRLLNDALDLHAGQIGRSLVLLITVNVYEILLIGLALFLAARRGIVSHARTLLIIQALFLVDGAFLNSELFVRDPGPGGIVNLVAVVLAIVKVGVVVFGLRLCVGGARLAYIALQLLLLYGMPGMFAKLSSDGELAPLVIYAGWWVASALLVLQRWFEPRERFEPAGATPAASVGRVMVWLYATLPLISLFVHIGEINWVYRNTFFYGFLSPVLLALAVNLGRYRDRVGRSTLWRWEVVLPLAALLLTVSAPDKLWWSISGVVQVTPLRAALVGTALVYAYLAFVYWQGVLAAMSAGSLACALAGPTVPRMIDRGTNVADNTGGLFKRLIPETALGWGVLTIIASFLLLGIGAAFSLRKRPEATPEDGDGEPVGSAGGRESGEQP